ncbi:MAG: hypothetical protein WCE45_04735 [Sedimentisphaerales bacterium]
MAKKRLEEIIYNIKQEVAKKVLAEISPIRKFPEDFLSAKVKKELAVPIKYPKLSKPGIKIVGREHRIRRAKIDPKKVNKTLDLIKEWEKGAMVKYEEIGLPEGELELNFGRKFEIRFAKSGMVLLGFASYERAKYLLYSRKIHSASSGQAGQCIYKIPKNEIVVKRAVRDYEKYLKEIRDNITKAFMARKANSDIADTLAREVLKEINLPYPYAI